MGKKLHELEKCLRQQLLQQKVVNESEDGVNNNINMYPLLEEKVFEEMPLKSQSKKSVPKLMLEKSTSCTSLDKLSAYDGLLSYEIGGRYILQSFHGTYLVPNLETNKLQCVDEKPGPEGYWDIVPWGHKVVFKVGGDVKLYLRNTKRPESFNLTHLALDWETWIPQKNADGSFSFLSFHEKWLSVNNDGTFTTKDKPLAWEYIKLIKA